MKRILIVLLFPLLFLAGCNAGQNSYQFYGESNSWEMTYKVLLEANNSYMAYVTIKYKEKDIESIGKAEYKIESSTSDSYGRFSLDRTGVFEMNRGGSHPPAKDEIIKVEIKWNGKSEKINLMLMKSESE